MPSLAKKTPTRTPRSRRTAPKRAATTARRQKTRRPNPAIVILATTAVVLSALLAVMALRGRGGGIAQEEARPRADETPATTQTPTAPDRSAPETRREAPIGRTTPSAGAAPIARRDLPRQGRQAARRGYIVIVIDDAGYNMKQLRPFLDLPFPLTIAVLPRLQYSEEAARAAREAGKDVLLHQPMEAEGGSDPGPGAILRSMSREEVISTIERNLLTVPGAVGMNNHMGSAVSADLYLMEAVAAVAKKEGIYYLDSLTVSGTAMPEAARREGIRYWERTVFLDNSQDRASIIKALDEGKKLASRDRPAVMIGHVWSAELAQTLFDLYPKLVDEGYSLSTISRFMLQEALGDDADTGD